MKQQLILILAIFMVAVSSQSQEIVFQNEYDFKENVTDIKVSSNSNLLAVGTNNRVELIDLNSLESIFESMIGEVLSVDISIDEQRLLALTTDKIIYEWDINTKQLIREINFFANIDSITGVRKAVYYPVDNRIFVDAFFEFQNTNKKYFYLYDNDENVIETGYKSFFGLFEFTNDGEYFIDAGLLSAIVTSERVPNLQQTLETSDIVETFKDYDPFDKPRAHHIDLSTNNQYALITSDKDDISVIDIENKLLFSSKSIKPKHKLNTNISCIDNSGEYLISSSNFEQNLSIIDLKNNEKVYESENILISGIINYIQEKKILVVNHFYTLYFYSVDLDIITSVQEHSREIDFNLYPSPSSESLTLEFDSESTGQFVSRLVDINGITLLEYPTEYVQTGFNTFVFDISSFPVGEYFLVTEGVINENFPVIIFG